MFLKRPWEYIKRLGHNLSKHDIIDLSAAFSYYTAFSLAPLLLITITFLGYLGHDAQTALIRQIQGVIGIEAARAVELVIEAANKHPELLEQGNIFGFVSLVVGASTMFAQLQYSFNVIFDADTKNLTGIWMWIRKRLLSIGMVLVLGFLSTVSLLASAAIEHYLPSISDMKILDLILTLGIFTFFFGFLFRVLPDKRPGWQYAYLGGGITAVLFTAGKYLIGLYLGQSAIGSAYGAAGTLIIFLVWVYYSSLILFLGAEITAAFRSHRPPAHDPLFIPRSLMARPQP